MKQEIVLAPESTLPNATLAYPEESTRSVNPKIVMRDEAPADAGVIAEVTVAAFKTLEISNHTEQSIIEALRAANALTLSLVAELDGRVLSRSLP